MEKSELRAHSISQGAIVLDSDTGEWVECRGKWTGTTYPTGQTLGVFDLPDWEPEHLHWNTSLLYIHDSGDVYFLSKRLSNQQNTGFESGRRFFAVVEFLFRKAEADPAPFYSYELAVCGLDWRTKVDCYERILKVPGLAPYFRNCYVSLKRHWRIDSRETPPTPIPFPPISFP